jgi:hypothetical protein
LAFIDDAAGLCERMAKIGAARIRAAMAGQILNPAHGVGGGAHRLAS